MYYYDFENLGRFLNNNSNLKKKGREEKNRLYFWKFVVRKMEYREECFKMENT